MKGRKIMAVGLCALALFPDIETLEAYTGELIVPSIQVLSEKEVDKNFTDVLLEATWTPWYYEEAVAYLNQGMITQDNQAYLDCILENDSTAYYRLMQEENEAHQASEQKPSSQQTDHQAEESNPQTEELNPQGEETASQPDTQISLPEEKKYVYEADELADYEALVKSFYVIDVNTKAGPEVLKASAFEQMDFSVPKGTKDPVIYIYHTHATEAFRDSREGRMEDTVVGAGKRLTELLTDCGYTVLHDETAFDQESRDYAYSNALPHLEQTLAEHPSIQVVIDLHRDEMPKETHLVSEINGKQCARYMFFNGMSWLKDKGEIGYLDNPNREQNLGFSYQLQKVSNEYYPGLARRIYLKAYRYNLHLRPASVLIELGAQNNSVEEIMNGCEPLAQVLDQVLSQ